MPFTHCARYALRPWESTRFCLVAATLACFGLACPAAQLQTTAESTPADVTAELLPPLYARYLSDGRSEVEIHLSAAGQRTSARVTPQADGSFGCHVGGLHAATALRPARPPPDPPDAASLQRPLPHPLPLPLPLHLAAVLVHEVTHCLVSPYTAQLLSSGDSEEARAANRLLQLTSESISDTRAVIEVFRRDGPAAAQALVSHLLPRRLSFADASHATALALRAALAHAQSQPESVQSPAQAFATALDLGRRSALQTWLEHVQAIEPGLAAPTLNPLQTPDFELRSRALDAALAQAKQAFGAGRFANRAFTLRRSHDAPSPSDRHIFVADDGTLNRVATISAEGAHRLNALQALMGNGGRNANDSDPTPEHTLTVRWLLHEGQLDTHSLLRARPIVARFLRSFGASRAQREQAAQTLGETIKKCRRGEGLGTLLDQAAQALQMAHRP